MTDSGGRERGTGASGNTSIKRAAAAAEISAATALYAPIAACK